ncbi:HD domain-containing phosphohydrolase [Methylophaga sulfidovorans]|uniref:HD-GYP domain, c-di-GMP phosphodiesterase class II (Or its inactivated variant) n=1 Tax=Methylophaga sulfidovorans TaxID=45496 RepID=A0A1I4AQG4_9GAMM|nr:HD domain-containing phosphohydrolase [Methylophaga sulfidovorans]SFK58614.1 HD-GYP domain, c-di-GMP phosphodiesterase class II (or its inactivated variant) [Methylophaga sulfidovorans]
MTGHRKYRFPFRLTIRLTVVMTFIFATFITAVAALTLQYYFMQQMATDAATERFNNLADKTSQLLNTIDSQAVETTRILASYPGLVNGNTVSQDARSIFSSLMLDRDMLYAIYLGLPNGDFYEVINLNSGEEVRKQLNADPKDRWVVVTINGEGVERSRTFEYYSSDFKLRLKRSEPSNYISVISPWFVNADENSINKTDPYLFHNIQAPGQTYSKKLSNGAVIAVDIALSSMSDYLSQHELTDFGQVFLYRSTGELLASNLPSNEAIVIPETRTPLDLTAEEKALIASSGRLKVSNEMDWAPIDFSSSGRPKGYSIDYLRIISDMTGLNFEYINGFSWKELVTQYETGQIDILQSVFDIGKSLYSGTFTDPYVHLPYSLVTKSGNPPISHLQQLAGKTVAIPQGWSIIQVVREAFPNIKIEEVPSTGAVFEAVSKGEADAGLDVTEILHYVGERFFYQDVQYHDDIGFAPTPFPSDLKILISDQNKALLPIINKAIAHVSDEQKTALAHKWFLSKQQGLLSVPYSPLLDYARDENDQRQLKEVNLNGEANYVYVSPFGSYGARKDYLGIVIPVNEVLSAAQKKVTFSLLMSIGFLLLLLPAPWLFATPIVSPIKKLAEENQKIRERQFEDLAIPDSFIREIDELGHSMEDMVAAIRQHEINQDRLMDSFIKLIVQAIDEKSHYTASHCERVPELAFMLAEQAECSLAPAFREFRFHSKEEWREFKVAAWLHDCGKITTPEHIVDKGSKLETIFNRIHEIRTRFEVLWRDAEIVYWQKMTQSPENEVQHQAELDQTHQRLKEDFAFVAEMNVGGEVLSEDKKVRLDFIAQTTWLRHFSNRLGLSPADEERISSQEESLPCEEHLLSDKPEHIIPRKNEGIFDPKLGIKMTIPEHLYNQGELYNLKVERGTLTAEDRFKINEHIISTIRMLEAMPFPEELSRVPRYASTHHEKMDGTGYPRKLSKEQLSVPERIMVLADIFEALTAADRPYKKAKKLSEAIDIMAKMVAEQHIDPDVFELFLTTETYKVYAEKFLAPEQIDEVDVARYLKN